ncbi:MAG: glycine--tRNA ligase subunit beta [bacterium]|nr:glycine--tRNA ligase subunit beta [bacterium]
MPKGEFLLEVRCEEIPARMVRRATQNLGSRIFQELLNRKLTPRAIETGFTPRRLTVALMGVPAREQDRTEKVTGPPASVAFDESGQPTQAAEGFARRCGIEPGDLTRVETPKGEYAAAVVTTEGRPTAEVLSEIAPKAIAELNWAKIMLWGNRVGPWARPVHGILALFEGEVVPFDLFGVESGKTTCGHPVLSPKQFSVVGFASYRKKLSKLGIEVNFKERLAKLETGLAEAAAELGGGVVEDRALLERLTAMCGTPGVVAGRIDDKHLELPREVLIASLRDHQSAFTVETGGRLLPAFLTLMDRADDPEGFVRRGNEWVVEARLEDAAFFYEEDRKKPLAEHAAGLDRLSFHEKLGSYADKSERIAELCKFIGRLLDWEDEARAAVEVARLMKADLVSEMVGEFSSLQGIMGGVYARAEGLDEEVWRPIYEQYIPQGSSDPITSTRVGRVVGLADRIDSIVGILGIGLTPSGSKDPFGLRRAAQGVVRIALEGEMELDLDLVAARAYKEYGDRLEESAEEVLGIWRPFLFDRIRHILGLDDFSYDEIEAALEVGATNLPDLRARVAAIHTVRDEPGFRSVVLAAKRIANILRGVPEQELDADLLSETAEKLLYQAYQNLKDEIKKAEQEKRYEECLRTMTSFADVLDHFFVEVLVMDENPDVRNNRVALLQAIQRSLSRTAGLTAVVVERAEEMEGKQGNG